jgi:hypothetical protein
MRSLCLAPTVCLSARASALLRQKCHSAIRPVYGMEGRHQCPAVAAAWNLNYSQQTCLTDETEKGQLHKMQFCSWKNGLQDPRRCLWNVWELFLLVVRGTEAETFAPPLWAKPLKIKLTGKQQCSLCLKPEESQKGLGNLWAQGTEPPGIDIYEHGRLQGGQFSSWRLRLPRAPCSSGNA